MGKTSNWIGIPDTLLYVLDYAGARKKDIAGTGPRVECRYGYKQGSLVLTFVTIRALFGIEFVRGHPEHIVALDAHAMQHGR
jgi:hypothetical protein